MEKPKDWSDPAGWDRYYSELLDEGDYSADIRDTGTISIDRIPQLISELRSMPLDTVWIRDAEFLCYRSCCVGAGCKSMQPTSRDVQSNFRTRTYQRWPTYFRNQALRNLPAESSSPRSTISDLSISSKVRRDNQRQGISGFS